MYPNPLNNSKLLCFKLSLFEKYFLKVIFDLIKESEVSYFWVAGGAIRDYFVTGGNTPKDLDIWFPDKENRNNEICQRI